MTRVAVACVLACLPFAVRADDPKPDVIKLKDEVEVLEAKLDVWKAKVAGADELVTISKDFLARMKEAQQKGAAAMADMIGLMQVHSRATTDLNVTKAEMRVAEVLLNQAKRRLAAAEKGAGFVTEKKYTLRFENKPWGEVFDWFAKESELLNAVKVKPTGTVTLKPRDGRQFTLTEVVDLLNEMMAPNFVLVRKDKTFTVLPADERPDTDYFASIEAADLSKVGRTELVQVRLPIPAGLNVEETVQQLKVMLSSFGNLRVDGKKNLLVWDKAGSVRRIKAHLDEVNGAK